MEIKVNDVGNCPFCSDLSSCKALEDSDINFCPATIEDEFTYDYIMPKTCPLKLGAITVSLGE